LNSVIGIAVKDIKTFFREKETLFWTIAFPVMILLLFTAIFGREVPFTANIGIIDSDKTPMTANVISWFNSTEIFSVKAFEDKTEALRALNATEVRAVVTLPKGFTEKLTTGNTYVLLTIDETSPDVTQLVRSGISTFFSEFYKQITNYTEPISVIEEASLRREEVGYKEHIVPGMLCYPFLFSSMVAATHAIVSEREKGTLKRIRASPIRPLNVLFGKTFAALFQTAISILIIAVLAVVVLRPAVNWNVLLLFPIMFLGSLNGIAVGLLISCIGRSPRAASNAATTIGVVLQFFIGMYFPEEFLPTYIQQIGNVIPMTYAVQAIRSIMIQNAVLSDLLQPISTLVISAVILYAIGILLYKRWVEKE
jgi:ABC-2 type transport system permease protein